MVQLEPSGDQIDFPYPFNLTGTLNRFASWEPNPNQKTARHPAVLPSALTGIETYPLNERALGFMLKRKAHLDIIVEVSLLSGLASV